MKTNQVDKILKVLDGAIQKGSDYAKGPCPHCKKDIQFRKFAEFDPNNKLTMTITMKPGHKLQALSLGRTMVAMAKVLQETAKEMGGKVQVLVGDLRVKEGEISVDYEVIEQNKRGSATPPSAAEVSESKF